MQTTVGAGRNRLQISSSKSGRVKKTNKKAQSLFKQDRKISAEHNAFTNTYNKFTICHSLCLMLNCFFSFSLYFTENTAYLNYKDQLCWEVINVCRSSCKVSVTFVSFLFKIYICQQILVKVKFTL
jgi:hypothetical protein